MAFLKPEDAVGRVVRDPRDFLDVIQTSPDGLCIHGDKANNGVEIFSLLFDLPSSLPVSERAEQDDPANGWVIRIAPAREISGRAATCFELTSQDVAEKGTESICYSSDESGLLLYRRMTTVVGASTAMEAVAILNLPNDADFVPPYAVSKS